ncbi:nuclear transport factor 2 family protein [Xylanimonas oleitrophica]|uniref:nuclear transport factor 2 family protein n=1 Tax=Xylanimonas oleitrophica TaxID=2607479 RepID=UPI0015CF9773|nr:nuclear transport factor 2 family protein [Xylanimonas oleitrophica]
MSGTPAGGTHDEPGPAARSTREVLEAHLVCRRAGDLERDLAENYAPDVALISWGEGVNHGLDGVRRLADVLRTYVDHASYRYHDLVTTGEYGMLRWSATAPEARIHDGTDSFVVRDGRIVAQTIAYAVDGEGEHEAHEAPDGAVDAPRPAGDDGARRSTGHGRHQGG